MTPAAGSIAVAGVTAGPGLVDRATRAVERGPAQPAATAGSPAPPVTDGAATRSAIAGDTGTGAAPEHATAEEMAEQGESAGYDGLVLLGDLV